MYPYRGRFGGSTYTDRGIYAPTGIYVPMHTRSTSIGSACKGLRRCMCIIQYRLIEIEKLITLNHLDRRLSGLKHVQRIFIMLR